MIDYLIRGLILGLTAGFTPGPLTTVVISETLRHGVKSGVKVALAPLVVDFPIIILAVLIFRQLTDVDWLMGLVSLCGAAVLFVMGLHSFRAKEISVDLSQQKERSFSKGVLVNALSPHPYIFWFTLGAPMLTRASENHPAAPYLFLIAFYMLLVGIKMGLAYIIGRSRHHVTGVRYTWVMRVLGVLLLVFAAILVKDGLKLLNIWQVMT